MEKWATCWTDCWEVGVDYISISHLGLAHFPPAELVHPDNREERFYTSQPDGLQAPFIREPDPELTFDFRTQERPNVLLNSLDKYILKVLVAPHRAFHYFTIVEIVEHIEMPKEQPPPSINEDNPMTVKEFKEQWSEDFYDQTISITGYVGGFGTSHATGLDYFSFYHEDVFDPEIELVGGGSWFTVHYPYGERVYFWKMASQGLRAGGPYTIRIHMHSPETNTIRGILWGDDTPFQERFPFVILWVDGDKEENLSKAYKR